jgi:predicted  nucleic acid-binding Zn-ribbon protein
MSPSSLESQIAEHTEHAEMHDQPGNLALSSADFSALEDRVSRAVKLVKSEREARAAAEHRADTLNGQLSEQHALVKTLQQEISALNAERDQVRQRVEKLLSQLDSLEL